VGGLGAAATTLTVASSAGFPATPFAVKIDGELIRVTNSAGNLWTIQRGYLGTTPAAHLNGSVVAFGNVYANPSLLSSAVLPTAVGVKVTPSSSPAGGSVAITTLPGFDR